MRVAELPLFAILAMVLVIALLLVYMALAPISAHAAGGEIRVVEMLHQVNYPSGVNLSATIESDEDIVEVRVYYRPARSDRWGYAYADFDPGTRVVATSSVPVRESTYIAPGADVEYYFEIRDSEGNVVRTKRAIVEYLDQRFDWKRVQIGPLLLLYHDISDSRIENSAHILREDLRRVEELLQLKQAHGLKGVIYNSYADANAAFPVQSRTTTDHGTFAGYAFPEQGVFVGQGLDRRIIVHEATHMMFHDTVGHRSIEEPAWLNEGLATYMEPDVKVRSSSQLYDRTPPLTAMKSVSGTPETIPLFYQKSVSVVAHLIEAYGIENFRVLLGEIAKGRTIDKALIAVYGFDEAGLDASWAGLPIPPPPTPAPVQQTDTRSEVNSRPTNEANRTDPIPGGATAAERPPGATSVARDMRPTPSVPSSPQDSRLPVRPSPLPPAPAPQSESPSPFLFIDVWVLAGVALLAVGAFAVRYIYNRVRRQDEWQDDHSQYWEEPE